MSVPRRPVSLTILAYLFIVVGAGTILIDVVPLLTGDAAEKWTVLARHWQTELAPAWAIRAFAIVGGVLMLRGAGWIRWGLAAWVAFHVAISASVPGALVMHSLLGAACVYIMFRRAASDYFRAASMV